MFVITIAVVCAILGIVTLIAGIAAKSNTLLELISLNNTIFIIGLIFGLVMLVVSAAGIYGIVTGKRCCIFLFCIVLGILALIFVALTIAIAALHHSFENSYKYIDCNKSGNNYLHELKNAYTDAAKLLCRDQCPCGYKHDRSS